MLQSQSGVKIKYTTDGSDPKENGGVYDSSFIIPPNTSFVQVVAECGGGYFASQSIRIDSKKKKELFVDKTKPLTMNRVMRAMDTKESYDNLELFKKHAESVSDVRIVLFKLDDKGNDSGYIELNIDSKIVITPVQVEITIDNLKNSFITNGRANIELECGKLNFKNGQAFYDYVNDKKMSLSEFKQEELIQR